METIFEYIEPFEKFLIILNRNGISIHDVVYFQAYREFLEMRSRDVLYWVCLDTLAGKYSLSIGTMRRKFRKFSERLA
jgi:hypothetical protein